MVGNEESDGYLCDFVSGIRCPPGCRGFGSTGACIFKRSHKPLEGEPRADDANAEDQAAAEADSEAGFYEPKRSRPFLMARPENTPSGSLLPDWLVHRIKAERDNGS